MRHGLDEATKENIKSLFLNGWSYRRISNHLRVTKGQVAGVLFRSGLCKRRPVRADNAITNAASAGGSQSA